MASSPAMPDTTASDIYVPQASKYLNSLKLHLNEPERAIICTICKYALQPESVTRHVGKHKVPLWERAALTRVVRSLDLPDAKSLGVRPDHSAIHPQLAVRHGYMCTRCEHRTTSKDLFRRHTRQKHGKAPAAEAWELSEILTLQSWLENGSSGLWIVQPLNGITSLNTASTPRRVRLERLHSLEHEALSTQRAHTASDTGSIDMSLVNNWLHRTSWNELFAGSDRALLVKLTSMPDRTGDRDLCLGQIQSTRLFSLAADEAKLRRILIGASAALERCRDTVRHTDISVRSWLRGQAPDRPYKAPFMLTGRSSSERTYERLVCRCISFCIRLWRLQEDKVPVPVRSMTATQRRALERLWSHEIWLADSSDSDSTCTGRLRRAASANNKSRPQRSLEHDGSHDEYEDVYSENDSNGDEEESESDGENSHIRVGSAAIGEDAVRTRGQRREAAESSKRTCEARDEVLADLVLELLYFLATEDYEDGKPNSTLLVFSASVLGISADGLTFDRPSNYTPKLSGLIHCIRLILLESTLPRFAHPALGWPARPRHGQLHALNAIRVEKMCLGSHAPMGELLSLRGYGRALSRSDGPSFRVRWSDDCETVSWEGGSLTMSQFKEIGRNALKHASSCCDRLMYHWKPPREDLSGLKDTLSDMSYGYSFVTEPANGLADAYLELSRLACLSNAGGLMADDDWDLHAVRQYLELQREFQGWIMLLISLFGGQMPRGTDLLAVAHCNSATNRRGIFVYDGKIAIMNQVNKARRATNREFYVVRFLPDNVAPLLYDYLVYIRRFCNMLHRTCIEQEAETPLLFPSVANPGEPRKTGDLTSILRECTETATGMALGVRVYRQLTIAITDKHIKQTSRPFNRYDDTTSEADVGVAFAWQSGHRPMQRGISYGLDGAFPDSLQPALLKVYRWVSEEWHAFLSFGRAPGSDLDGQEPSRAITPSRSPPTQQNDQGYSTRSGPGQKRSASELGITAAPSKRRKPKAKALRFGENTSQERARREDEGAGRQEDSESSISGSPWATTIEMDTLRRTAPMPWRSCAPLFGRVTPFERTDVLEERRLILDAVRSEEARRNRYFHSHERLRVLDSLRKWSSVGCQLCFVQTSEPQPDHTLLECRLWPCCERAHSIWRWLKDLPLPLHAGFRGFCSLCTHTDAPCDEVRLSNQIGCAYSEDERKHWEQLLESKPGPDGHCENRPIIREVIAALCAYDDQALGKMMVAKISECDEVDFAAENHVAYWFLGRVSFKGDWISRLLFMYEMLVYAFEHRRRLRNEGLDCGLEDNKQNDALSMGWDDQNEVKHWERCLQWWVGKCGYCAGKGLRGASIEHSLRSCHRGGAQQLQRELGECIHMEGFRPRYGCTECGCPREFCEQWQYCDDTWIRSRRACQYRSLLYDTLIGLYYCDESTYRLDARSSMEEDSDPERTGRRDEDVAIWLCARLEVAGVECSLFIRTLGVWTKMVWRRQAI